MWASRRGLRHRAGPVMELLQLVVVARELLDDISAKSRQTILCDSAITSYSRRSLQRSRLDLKGI